VLIGIFFNEKQPNFFLKVFYWLSCTIYWL